MDWEIERNAEDEWRAEGKEEMLGQEPGAGPADTCSLGTESLLHTREAWKGFRRESTMIRFMY